MSVIKIENLTFAYPSSFDNIFENVSFQIDTNWKLGFIGRNGRGKTTFLNILQGKYEYQGKITSSVQFDYFPYSVPDRSKITNSILQGICPIAEEWQIMRELSYPIWKWMKIVYTDHLILYQMENRQRFYLQHCS